MEYLVKEKEIHIVKIWYGKEDRTQPYFISQFKGFEKIICNCKINWLRLL